MRRLMARVLAMKTAEAPPDSDRDGRLTPQELHQHFDRDGDGRVSPEDYDRHIREHMAHPEWLDGKTAMARLALRLEKRAFSVGEMLGAGVNGALMGGVVGGGVGALSGLGTPVYPEGVKTPSRMGRAAHGGLLGLVTGAVPSAISSMYSNYRQQSARDQALKQYQAQGGYGHEFAR